MQLSIWEDTALDKSIAELFRVSVSGYVNEWENFHRFSFSD